MRSCQPAFLFMAAATLSLAHAAHAQEVVHLNPSLDNTIWEPQFGGEYSSGIGANLYAGKNNGGSLRRALLMFDLSSIPAGSTITSAELTLTCNHVGDLSSHPCSLHRALASWGEGASDAGDPGGLGAAPVTGDATWTYRFFEGSLWTTPGGDFAATASATKGVGVPGTYKFGTTAAMIADVQSWVDAPSTNAGWVLLGDEAVPFGGGARRFGSREAALENERPLLTIEFTLPAGCDSIDFNGDSLFPDTADIDDFLSVFSGGPCSNDPNCGEIDFNNDGLFPDTLDIDSLLSVFSGGPCLT